VLFSDEASFSNNGGVNKHNCHYYAQNSPRWIREGQFQTVYSTNIWNIGEQNYRTIFFRERLNGLVYLNFLQNILLILLEEIDLHRTQNMWLQQDGAPPHFHSFTRDFSLQYRESK
jgi:hypothetical protein